MSFFNKKKHLLLLLAALAISLFYVRIRLNIYHLSYDLNSNLKIQKDLIETNKKLKIEAASLKAPDRVGRLAVSKLGLKINSGAKTVLIEDYDDKSQQR